MNRLFRPVFSSCSQAALLWGRICHRWPETTNGLSSFVVVSSPAGATSASWLTCMSNMVMANMVASVVCNSCIRQHHPFKIQSCLLVFPVRPLGCAEVDDVLQKCEHVLESLDQLDEQLFSEWTVGLEQICQSHLKEPLLMLDTDTGRFHVNFSPAVSSQKKKQRNETRATTVERCSSVIS